MQSFTLSKAIYLSQVIPPPRQVIESMQQSFWQFLWEGGKPLVKRSACLGPPSQGGLWVVSVDLRFKSITVKWIRKCFDPTIDAGWKYFALFWLSQLGNPYYSKLEWMAAFAFRPAPRNLRSIPYYYQHIYEVWKKCDGGRLAKSPRSLAEAMTEPLWGNPCIRAGGRPLFYPSQHA